MTKKKASLVSSGPRAVAMAAVGVLLTLGIVIFHCDEFKMIQSTNFNYQFRNNNGFEDHTNVFQSPPKIAFLFLTRTNLPLDFLWANFFKNGDEAKYSIYIHSQPGFVYDKSTTKSSFFYGTQLNNSVQVLWGESSMIKAERLLFGAALHDPANQRFVLLSDSCIPLHNFSHTYSYLMSSRKSFVDSFLNVNEDRYNPKMSPVILRENWRKGSQWITLVRKHAEVVVNDAIIFPLFEKFCKRWPPAKHATKKQTLEVEKKDIQKEKYHPNCIPDEHYVQTLLSIRGLDDELERRTLTYTTWNSSIPKSDKRSWHPVTFHFSDATPLKIKEIKEINHIDFESEHRSDWCRVNSIYVSCFLFARKFAPGAAMRILKNDG